MLRASLQVRPGLWGVFVLEESALDSNVGPTAHAHSIMNWYYAQAGETKGPVTDDELAQMLQSGLIGPDTLVWREGMAEWKPLSVARDGAPPANPTLTVAAAGGLACVVCGKPSPGEELVEVAGLRVCAACKPVVLQGLREGAAIPTMSGGPDADMLTEEEVLARDYEIPVTEAVGAGFSQLFGQSGTLLLGGVLVVLVLFGSQVIPYLGILATVFLHGPLQGGLTKAYLKHLRGGRMEVGDGFQGFGPSYWSLVRAFIVPALLAGLAYIPAVAVGVPLLALGIAGGASLNVGAPVLAIVGFAILLLGGAVAGTYLTVSWMYTMLLVADRGYRVLPAMKLSRKMVGRHFWQHLWLMIFLGIVALLGFLACGLGILVAMPITFFAQAFVYERVWKGLRHAGQGARA